MQCSIQCGCSFFCSLIKTKNHDFVTTVPLSVCCGALNLLVRKDASNFVPYACDRAVTGGVRGSRKYRTVVRYSGGSVAGEQSYRTSGTLAPVFPVLGLA